MYINDETNFVDLTEPSKSDDVIGFFLDGEFNAHVVTNQYGTGYGSFRKARAFLRSRRYGVGSGESANNTLYIINSNNEMYQDGMRNIARSVNDGS